MVSEKKDSLSPLSDIRTAPVFAIWILLKNRRPVNKAGAFFSKKRPCFAHV